MASPDVQIVRDGPTDVPLNYVLPQSAGLQPLAVNAVFDGSSAAGDYLPCVVIIGSSGTVIARTAADTTVTAGDDAEVSWFPGVKNAPAGSVSGFTPAFAVGSKSGLGVVGPGTVGVTWDDFETTDPSVFSLNGADSSKIEMAEPGIVLLSGNMQTTTQPTSFTTTNTMFAVVTDANGIDVGTYFGNLWYFADATAGDPKEVTLIQGDDYANCAVAFMFPISIRAFFFLGQAVGIGGAHLAVTRLTPVGV